MKIVYQIYHMQLVSSKNTSILIDFYTLESKNRQFITINFIIYIDKSFMLCGWKCQKYYMMNLIAKRLIKHKWLLVVDNIANF